ncbi:MAG TPA: hypothetical protein VLV45_13485 [Gemmatimonadales bacterium]|nr:hypothetical protein [Gemmatimonadales bacterium]
MARPRLNRRIPKLLFLIGVAAAALGSCNYESFVLPPPLPKDYVIHELGLLPGGTQSQARAGSMSTIVGWGIVSGTAHHAVTFSGGQAHALTEPAGAANSEARGVNNPGTIVGFATLGGVRQAIYWASATAPPLILPTLGDSSGFLYGFARSINDAGVILGSAQDTTGDSVLVTWTPDGSGGYDVAPVDTSGAGVDLDATAINNPGQISGNADDDGFIYTPGDSGLESDDVDAPEGGTDPDVNGMSNLGVIAGSFTAASGLIRSFIYTGAAGSIQLSEPPTGYTAVGANAVNDSGVVSATLTGTDSANNTITRAVVGSIVDTASTWTVLPTLGGLRASPQDNAINNCGVVFGSASKAPSATVLYAVAWVPTGCTIP